MRKTIYILLPVLLLTLQGTSALAVDAETLTTPQHTVINQAKTVGRTAGRNAELAGILGVTPDQLAAYFAEGKTFQDVITLKGVSMETVLEKLKASRIAKTTARINADVAAGKITTEKATELKSNLQKTPQKKLGAAERNGIHGNAISNGTGTTRTVEGKSGTPGREKNGRGQMMGMQKGKGAFEPLAKILGITPEEMQVQMKAGKTIDELIAAKGLDKDTVHKQLEAARPMRPIDGNSRQDGGRRHN